MPSAIPVILSTVSGMGDLRCTNIRPLKVNSRRMLVSTRPPAGDSRIGSTGFYRSFKKDDYFLGLDSSYLIPQQPSLLDGKLRDSRGDLQLHPLLRSVST